MNYYSAVKTFVRLAELKSFTKAAQQLSIKPSTASRHISYLESDMGVALFNRTTRDLCLTEAGNIFYEKISTALDDFDLAREVTASLNESPVGDLKINIPIAFYQVYIMSRINKFKELFPGINLIINCQEFLQNFVCEGFDIAIKYGVLNDSTFIAHKLVEHYYVACISANHQNSIKTKLTLNDIQKLNIVTCGCNLKQKWFITTCKSNSPKEIDLCSTIVFDNDVAVEGFVKNTTNICLLPYWYISSEELEHRFINVLPEYRFHKTMTPSSIFAMYAFKKRVSPKVKAFIDFIK
ncbi:TPA: LysR family transcriptional regulator [Salmonella enterica]